MNMLQVREQKHHIVVTSPHMLYDCYEVSNALVSMTNHTAHAQNENTMDSIPLVQGKD